MQYEENWLTTDYDDGYEAGELWAMSDIKDHWTRSKSRRTLSFYIKAHIVEWPLHYRVGFRDAVLDWIEENIQANQPNNNTLDARITRLENLVESIVAS